MREVRSSGQRFWIDEEGIVHCEVDKHLVVGRVEAEDSTRRVAELGGGRRRPIVVDLRGIDAMDREARLHYAGPETARVVSAAALIVSSPLSKAIGNFFMGLNKPLSPTRMFTDVTEALEWLRAFR